MEGEEEGRRENRSKTQLAYPRVVTAFPLGNLPGEDAPSSTCVFRVRAGRWAPPGSGRVGVRSAELGVAIPAPKLFLNLLRPPVLNSASTR